ncbi:PapD-like protein [Cladorrhinum samala]|uniref:PapD-like protein n=1 Tax=Cladorrhinum samala TaxID=585594 RepID=A0AAV9H8S9_9PEZI|nr:PapD-like protein [Cladorrhinum samala]
MSVEIDPSELGFRRPFTVEVSQVLKIRNPNSSPVAFKVKTTAPKQYCVRPNSGRIEPGHEVEVSVLLQAMKQEPSPDARCRDKFLVQSVTITADQEFNNIQQIWDGVEKSAIQERKIRVNWLPAQEDGRADAVSTPARRSLSNANQVEETPSNGPAPTYSSPDQTAATVESTPAPQAPMEDAEENPSTSYTQPGPAIVTAVKTAVAEDYEAIKTQLAEAKATIAKLTSEAASGLRQRKAAATSEQEEAPSKQPELAQASRPIIQGVSVKIVAVLCLVSFLLGYFFF